MTVNVTDAEAEQLNKRKATIRKLARLCLCLHD